MASWWRELFSISFGCMLWSSKMSALHTIWGFKLQEENVAITYRCVLLATYNHGVFEKMQ